MIFRFSTAFKNLGRAKLRTIVTTSTAAFGVMGYLFFASLDKGTSQDMLRVQKTYISGESQLLLQRAFENQKEITMDNLFDYTPLIPQLDKLEEKKVRVEPKVLLPGELIFYKEDGFLLDGSLRVTLVGTDISKYDIPGRISGFSAKEALDKGESLIWMSDYLADKLGAQVGESLVVSTKTAGGSYEAIDVKIAGLFSTPSAGVNVSQIFLSNNILSDYLGIDIKKQATGILFDKGKLSFDLSGVKDLTYHKWEDLSEDVLFMFQFQSKRLIFFNIFMTIIVCVGIINTMLMNVYERLKEIGIMRAYGVKDGELVNLFVQEGLAMGILSSILGVILGIIIMLPIIYIGIDLTHVAGATKAAGPIILRGAWPWEAMVRVVIYNLVISMLFSALVAFSATRKTVLECLNA